MNVKSRSEHISYDFEDHLPRKFIRKGVISLVLQAWAETGTSKEIFKILDLGCGLGLLMRDLNRLSFKTTGLDFDPNCVKVAKKFGNCVLGDIKHINDMFKQKSFDLVIASHCLEHLENPKKIVEKMKEITKKWIIIAVPNPVRPKVLVKYDLLGKNYSNKGHFYCWDRSHLSNFLERHCNLKIRLWSTDDVKLVPNRYIRKLFNWLTLLELVEVQVLPRLLPYFSTSLIVLCSLKPEMVER